MTSSIKDRIQQIMTAKQLSPARFADTVGIQRPLVSHILSERNKPGTEVITKIATAFPSINAEWLLLGIGDMYKGEQNSPIPSLFDEREPVVVERPKQQTENPPKKEPPAAIPVAENVINEKNRSVTPEKRNVERMIVFYSDGTFEELEAKRKY